MAACRTIRRSRRERNRAGCRSLSSRAIRPRSRWPTSSSTARRSGRFTSGCTDPTLSCASPIRSSATTPIRPCFIASVVAIILASCIGYLFARNLVAPINCMTKTARAIKEGDLSARTDLHGEDEIARLGETFDVMAESVEKDRELERRLTTDVAHELRTPLMAIQATVEAMVDGVRGGRGAAGHGQLRGSASFPAGRRAFKLSRLENRSQPMKEELVNVGELISGIVATHEMFVSDSGLTSTTTPENDVMVVGDPDMIRQATANLISERHALHARGRSHRRLGAPTGTSWRRSR